MLSGGRTSTAAPRRRHARGELDRALEAI